MREVKFRAWDCDNDHMIYGVTVTPEGVAQADWGKDKPDWPLMQYTGLTDANDVEIYEGDILRDVDSGDVGYVEYNHSYYAFYQATEIFGVGRETQFDLRGFVYEVIGNIYEHPELLDEPK